jgi:hypothetical protein
MSNRDSVDAMNCNQLNVHTCSFLSNSEPHLEKKKNLYYVIPLIQMFQSKVEYHAKFNQCAKFHENPTCFMIIILKNISFLVSDYKPRP